LKTNTLNVDWSEIGGWIQQHLSYKDAFKIWPLSSNEGVMFASSSTEKERLISQNNLKIDGMVISFLSWSSSVTRDSSASKLSNAWIVVTGIPQQDWDLNLFYTIGAACGGLEAISHETKSGEVISEIRLKVKGPVNMEPWVLGLTVKDSWMAATISLAEKQVEHSLGIHRCLVFEANGFPATLDLKVVEDSQISRKEVACPLFQGTTPLINASLPNINVAQRNVRSTVSNKLQNLNSGANSKVAKLDLPNRAHMGYLPKGSIYLLNKSVPISSPFETEESTSLFSSPGLNHVVLPTRAAQVDIPLSVSISDNSESLGIEQKLGEKLSDGEQSSSSAKELEDGEFLLSPSSSINFGHISSDSPNNMEDNQPNFTGSMEADSTTGSKKIPSSPGSINQSDGDPIISSEKAHCSSLQDIILEKMPVEIAPSTSLGSQGVNPSSKTALQVSSVETPSDSCFLGRQCDPAKLKKAQ
ncbi:hypothetical protein MKW94_010808, partial [Papaver nudicaule]|nr:hypothetical protein [Papaver nudicaule]